VAQTEHRRERERGEERRERERIIIVLSIV